MTHPELVRAIHPSAIHLNVCLAHSTDSDKANARLIGIEYIISRRLFEGLPADEKRFWHSHEHEVRNWFPGSIASLAACDIADVVFDCCSTSPSHCMVSRRCQILEAGDRLLLKCSRRHLAHVRNATNCPAGDVGAAGGAARAGGSRASGNVHPGGHVSPLVPCQLPASWSRGAVCERSPVTHPEPITLP